MDFGSLRHQRRELGFDSTGDALRLGDVDELDLPDHQAVVDLSGETSRGSYELCHVGHCRDDAGLLHRHRDDHIATIDEEVESNAQRQRERPDDVLDHEVGVLHGEGMPVECSDLIGFQVCMRFDRIPPLAGRELVEARDSAGA